MDVIHAPHSSSRRLAFHLAASLGLIVGTTACRAPGMKLTSRTSKPEQKLKVGKVQVTLRPIQPQTLPVPSAGRDAAKEKELQDLLVTKPAPYTVGPQDILMVTVYDHPELNQASLQARSEAASGITVDEDGSIYFPFVDRLLVKGLTVSQVRAKLAEALGKTLRNPQVEVKILLFRSQRVFVGGEVRNPSVYNITDVPFTLAEAASRAGGFSPTADLSRVVLSRGNRRWTLDFNDLLEQGNHIGRIVLQDGDSVHVPHRDETPVYLLGEVRTPRSVPMLHGHLSLAQALSEAGSFNTASADARSVYVLRRGATPADVDVFHLDSRNPVAMVLADRFPLQPRDLVYVDSGTLVRWNKVVSLMLPIVGSVTATASDVRYLSTPTP